MNIWLIKSSLFFAITILAACNGGPHDEVTCEKIGDKQGFAVDCTAPIKSVIFEGEQFKPQLKPQSKIVGDYTVSFLENNKCITAKHSEYSTRLAPIGILLYFEGEKKIKIEFP